MAAVPERERNVEKKRHSDKLAKGAWGMPRLPEATKDAISCENPRGAAHEL